MAKNEYLKVLDYGEWLKEFLDENVTIWQFKQLAINAIELTGIDYTLNESDHSIICIEELAEEAKQMGTLNFDKLCQKYLVPKSNKLRKRQIKVNSLMKEAGEKGNQKKADKLLQEWGDIDYINYPIITVIKILHNKKLIKYLLKEISLNKMPWGRFIGNILSQEEKKEDFRELQKQVDILFWGYRRVCDILKVDKEGIKKHYTFSQGLREYEDRDVFDWDASMSRIFFDFLLLGGQEYYGFCKRCDKFFVIQRKGRKKYCGDSCRALAHKEKISLK